MAKPTSKDPGNQAKTAATDELRDDDLQEVSGGVLINHPTTGPVSTGPISPTNPTGPTTGPTTPVCTIN
jgi:hypothetical protein